MITEHESAAPLDRVHVVLSRPSEAQNIGATCRALKSCAISRLSIVTDRPVDFARARPLAVSAADLLESAEVIRGADTVAGLRSVVRHSVLVAGVTRRVGQKRKTVSFLPDQFAERVMRTEGPVAVVFGNEQSGLSVEELAACHIAVTIPTSPACPSLNLSHAVQIIAYELFRAAISFAQAGPPSGSTPREAGVAYRPVSAERLTQTVDAIAHALRELGHPVQPGPQGTSAFLNDILARAALSATEAERIMQLFRKLAGMHGPRVRHR